MSEAETTREDREAPKTTPEEVRWRMDRALRYADAQGISLAESAKAVNKALATLSGQGGLSSASDQPS